MPKRMPEARTWQQRTLHPIAAPSCWAARIRGVIDGPTGLSPYRVEVVRETRPLQRREKSVGQYEIARVGEMVWNVLFAVLRIGERCAVHVRIPAFDEVELVHGPPSMALTAA